MGHFSDLQFMIWAAATVAALAVAVRHAVLVRPTADPAAERPATDRLWTLTAAAILVTVSGLVLLSSSHDF